MNTARIGNLTVSRLLLGSNPFSGFSHQGTERDREMLHYYTVANIKRVFADAEKNGITALVARADYHIIRTLMEYRDEGGQLTWLAQTCPEVGPTENCVRRLPGHASAAYIHGGVMDYLVAQNKFDEIKRGIDEIRKIKIPAGVAGHSARTIEWADRNLELDFLMCCYYNPSRRDENPEHVHGAAETYREEDRKEMTDLIQALRAPAIHYKIFACGRNDPGEAVDFAVKAMRPQDLVAIGVYPKDDPEMLKKDVALFEKHWKAR